MTSNQRVSKIGVPPRKAGSRRLGRPLEVTDAELVCLAAAQVLLRYDDERRWLRAAPTRVGHLFPRLLGQSEYNDRIRALAPLMEAALRWLADHTPGSAVEVVAGVYRARPHCGIFRSTAEGVSRMTAGTNTPSKCAPQRSR